MLLSLGSASEQSRSLGGRPCADRADAWLALLFHQRFGTRFEVQAQQQLGVPATWSMCGPVGYDRQAVEVRHRALSSRTPSSRLTRTFEGTSATGVLISPVMK